MGYRQAKQLLNQQLSHKLIPQPLYGHDQAGLFGIGFELLAQAAHVDVHGAGKRVFAVAPDFFEQHIAGERGARILYEVAQQLKLARRERHGLSLARDGGAANVHAQITKLTNIFLPDAGCRSGNQLIVEEEKWFDFVRLLPVYWPHHH